MTSAQAGVVVMAYGSPRTPEDIEAYYTDIRRGRPPTPEQLADLTRRYEAIGGTSRLSVITEAQCAGLQAALDERAPGHFVARVGSKHATPRIEDTVDTLAAGGATRIFGLVLAPHFSALSVGEYLHRARAAAGAAGRPFAGVESWATEPAYVAFLASDVRDHLDDLPPGTHVLFTAHSLPARILAAGDPYPDELRTTAEAVAAAAGLAEGQWSVAWQSAGRTPEPWLGPDVLQVVDELAARGRPGLLVCPCGFVADHLEVCYDLDIEARQAAESRGLAFARTRSMNDDATVLGSLAERVIALD